MFSISITNILLLISSSVPIIHCSNSSTQSPIVCHFTFGSMALLSGSRPRKTVAAGFNMALEDYKHGYLNNNQYLNITHIHNCTLSTNMNDMKSDIKVGIVEAFEFGQSFDRNNKNMSDINIPLIIGPPTSGYSLTLNPLFTAFNLLQFSSTATSTFLSDYPQFFRSVPSDDLQANALIQICKYFNWKNIGIMYMNTNYGSSLQQSLTSYAKNNEMQSTTFSYIDGDNITISDAVESMKLSGIYINILIAYGSDLEYITSQIRHYDMIGYPYYFLGTDSWLGTIGEDAHFFSVYGGVIGTCPWSPSLNDSFAHTYPFPINESIKMFMDFNDRWTQYYNMNETRYDVLYGYSEPGFFTGYGYDNVLTVIKSIDEYIKLYGWNVLYNNNINITARFEDILHSLSFVGLTGNVSYDMNGDRENGLFSFCNVDPVTGEAERIGYVIDNKYNDLMIDIDEERIKWPHDFAIKHIIPPQYQYIKYEGIPKPLIATVWCICIVSISFAVFCILCLFYHRMRPIIKSSQWRLSCVMCLGVIIAYIAIIIYGIDEVTYSIDYGWKLYCNYRLVLFNLSFGLSFGPLFFKVYRIRAIFITGMKQLQKTDMTDTKMASYNLIYVVIDFVLCLILIIVIPYNRIYFEAEQFEIEMEFYGNCSSQQFWWIYGLVLLLPKLVLCIYAIIISISVYNTVSMMKFNEGLQVLITVVISVILIFILVIILTAMNINSKHSASFYYGFMSLILIMICNFCIIVMLLPRLVAIWTGHEEDVIKEDKTIEVKIKKYLQKLKTFRKYKKDGDYEFSSIIQSVQSVKRKNTESLTPVTPAPTADAVNILNIT